MATGSGKNDLLKTYGIQIPHVPRPRAPPLFFRPPPPVLLEKPQPLVSDVSLIVDSTSTSMHSVAESLPEDITRNYLINNDRTVNRKSPQQIPPAENSIQVSPKRNYASYFPSPPLVNQTQSPRTGYDHDEQSNSYSQDDSGHGTSSVRTNVEENATVSQDLPHENQMSRSGGSGVNSSIQTSDLNLLRSDIASVAHLVNQQQATINKLSSQISTILSFQEKMHLTYSKNRKNTMSKEVQTEINEATENGANVIDGVRKTESLSSGEGQRHSSHKSPDALSEKIDKKSISSRNKNEKSPLPECRNTKNNDKINDGNCAIPVAHPTKGTRPSSMGERNIEDFSTLLRHLQLTDGHGQSIYSEASIKPHDFSQFKDESFHDNNENEDSHAASSYIGPSASAYGSDSDAELESPEPSKPTVTYYNNLLTTVNRFLDTKIAKNSDRPVNLGMDHRGASSPNTNAVATPLTVDRHQNLLPCSRASTASYTSGSSVAAEDKENIFLNAEIDSGAKYFPPNRHNHQEIPNVPQKSTDVVEVTKKYLQSIGAQFDSPTPSNMCNEGNASSTNKERNALHQHQQNYMIQQNVYNSIYIPTVNCVAGIGESMNSNSGFIENLANKYIPPAEMKQYELLTNKNDVANETTVYGMSANNLSFATRQYLQRYGLVGQGQGQSHVQNPHLGTPPVNKIPSVTSAPTQPKADRILDITAIRNQPKFL